MVFRINFSLKVSSLTLGSGLKPSIIGGRSKSKDTEEGSEVSPCCLGAAGAEDAAILDVNVVPDLHPELDLRHMGYTKFHNKGSSMPRM